jgi:plasmid stabilization system protein ParE
MSYQILIHRLAQFDLSEAYQWAFQRVPTTATNWLDRFQDAIRSLSDLPQRCPLAVENRKINVEIREFRFGRRPNVYRVIFHIDGSIVRVLRIRRGQRYPLTKKELTEALQNEPTQDE